MQKTIKYFKNIDNFDELKTEYKKLVKAYHPDINPDNLVIMQEINAEYDYLLANLSKLNDKTVDTDLEDQFKEIILELSKLDLDIEVCGSWLWLHGDTKPVKAELKALGCFWAAKKKLWYWRSPDAKRTRKSDFTMAEIRARHGSHFLGSKKKLLRA